MRKKYICIKPTKQMTKGKYYWGFEKVRHDIYAHAYDVIEIVNDRGYTTQVSLKRLKLVETK